jgi:hypothetical protein
MKYSMWQLVSSVLLPAVMIQLHRRQDRERARQMFGVQVIHGGVSEPSVYDLLFFNALIRLAANRKTKGELTIC